MPTQFLKFYHQSDDKITECVNRILALHPSGKEVSRVKATNAPWDKFATKVVLEFPTAKDVYDSIHDLQAFAIYNEYMPKGGAAIMVDDKEVPVK